MVGRQNGTTSMEVSWQYLQNFHFLFDSEIPLPSFDPKNTLTKIGKFLCMLCQVQIALLGIEKDWLQLKCSSVGSCLHK